MTTASGLILACTWRPRGELDRLRQLLPLFEQAYTGIAVSLPPDADAELMLALEDLIGGTLIVPMEWSHGRHAAIQKALELPGEHIHYADMDRLLHWAETRPQEWQGVLKAIPRADCLVIGRTEAAWQTHPQSWQQTEATVNNIFSHLFGRPMDFGAGSRGFSRRAAEFLMGHSPPGRAIGTDAEWPVLLQRAGFAIDYLAVDGLDWEVPDHYAAQAADRETQLRAAVAYDQDLAHWIHRVQVAMEIVKAGLEANRQELNA